ncbi:MAG: sigma-70 family RNA polymerase sigma factor [Bacteroidales bacterium]|nr:sigma-70 family RNA polymerase sigma factor [Bacteroidales bacterium]MCF8388518.1 sigma-70 family RNA polymerase sigma factor [Bacteroidales bacterium]MCF8399528.1 sigma-70 family RNA polymerase sigma factor [Bacteroidales bacterium]
MLIRKFSDQEIIEGIKIRNLKVLNYVYYKYYPVIEAYVIANNGSQAEAMDVFQESIFAVFENIQNPNFALTTSFINYLISICRNNWRNVLSRDKRIRTITLDDLDENIPDDKSKSTREEMLDLKKMDLFIEYLNKLPKTCRIVLELFFANYSFKEIAKRLNISVGNARKIKHDCIKKLHEEIRKDKRFKRYIDDEENG